MAEAWKPDVVVGVDFGMTCTGVAYSMGPDWAEPKPIQNWPGTSGHELRNKVTTAIAYSKRTGALQAWGLLVDPADPDVDVQELFKLFLDPNYQSEYGRKVSVMEARQWFQGFLSKLYTYIERFFSDSYPRWEEKKVEYLFSTPTTWTSPALTADIEALAKQAGFGSRENTKVIMSLTEAEAAAVYTAKQTFKEEDVILVCDAGGGTTDLNVLKMVSSGTKGARLKPLSWVEGRTVGSTLIDYKVETLIADRLRESGLRLRDDPSTIAIEMMRDKFEPFKRSFGSEATQYPALYLPIPGLPPGHDVPNVRISDSKIVLQREELQAIFDDQVSRIFKVMDEQIFRLQHDEPRELISYLVLSGGLGSSPYLRQRLRERYEHGGFPNAPHMNILVAADPQLAVSFGLVMDRIQRLSQGTMIYSERRARNSYGVICRQVYDPAIHEGETVSLDPRDKVLYAERQVDWLVRKGEVVSAENGITQTYGIKLAPNRDKDPWSTEIVMSTLPPTSLPRSTKHTGVKPVCHVEALLDPSDMKLKNRHWWNFGSKYWRAEFMVKVVVGAADLRFQLWSKSGEKCNRDHEEISVVWDTVENEATPKSPQQGELSEADRYASDMYRMKTS